MAIGEDFTRQLELRFAQLPDELRGEKREEYEKRFAALLEEGKTEAEAEAELLRRLDLLPRPVAEGDTDYGRITKPKKPLLTGSLYALALIIVLAFAALITKLLG